jgi:hypothetical protein
MEIIRHKFVKFCISKFRRSNHRIGSLIRSPLHESYRTLRDGCFGWRRPRHFVPGYDQPVPPGQKPFAHSKALALS